SETTWKQTEIMLVETTGASRETAGANHDTAGEDASGKTARDDLDDMTKYKDIVDKRDGRAGGRAIRATEPPLHKRPNQGEWDSEEHLEEATGGGIAAYVGVGNIHSHKEVDVKTTGGDYSNDDVARARWYHIYWYQDRNPYCQI
uniref:Uncharacterized protein n=1 Tax=Salmo trutta TaxID=8032 RepID=A0A674BQB0_SALTR